MRNAGAGCQRCEGYCSNWPIFDEDIVFTDSQFLVQALEMLVYDEDAFGHYTTCLDYKERWMGDETEASW